MEAAKVIPIGRAQEPGYELRPGLKSRVRGNGRAIAVAKLRELADLLERGVLDGVRCQWLDTHGELREDDGTQISGMETVTRTAWREDGSGQVQLTCTTIEEI